MSAFDTRFMWRPQTTEQAAQFSNELLKNSWAAGVVASIAYPYVGLAMAGVALLEKCGGTPSDTKDVFVRDLQDAKEDAAKDALTDVPIQPDVPIKDNQAEQFDTYDTLELRDLYEVRDAFDQLEINDSFELSDSTPEIFVAQHDQNDFFEQKDFFETLPDVPKDIADIFDTADVSVDAGDNLDLLDQSDETSTPPPVCLIGNASESFLVVKGFADPEMLQPLSLTEFLADLAPATPPASPIYISVVIYNAGDEVLPVDEEGLKLCYHGAGVSTCEENVSFELACDDSLVYEYGPISSIGLYGWTSIANGAPFEVRESTSSYGLTIYADPSAPDTSCYSLFNTFSCEYL